MNLDLTIQEVEEISAEAERHCPSVTSIDYGETIFRVPSKLGSSYEREVELCPGLYLSIVDMVSYDVTMRFPENDHPVQFAAYLSGVLNSGDYLQISSQQAYIGGRGVQPHHFMHISKSSCLVGVEIHMTPALFQQFFADAYGKLPVSLKPLVQVNDWQRRFSPKTTGAMRTVVQQMIDCPFLGTAKQAYLQGKVFELIAL